MDSQLAESVDASVLRKEHTITLNQISPQKRWRREEQLVPHNFQCMSNTDKNCGEVLLLVDLHKCFREREMTFCLLTTPTSQWQTSELHKYILWRGYWGLNPRYFYH